MSGQAYRGGGGEFERADRGRLALSDDESLLSLLLVHPDFLVDDVVFFADGRVLPESDPAWRTMIGWHRRGGPVLLGLTTGTGRPGLLVEALDLAEATHGWPLDRWDAAVAAYWESADPAIRERVSERWQLSADEPWPVAAWTRAAWQAEPTPARAVVGVLAAAVPLPVRRAIAWLAAGAREVAAFEARRAATGESPTYWTSRVAGGWHRPSAAAPDDAAGLRRATYVRHTGGVTARLLAAIEAACRDAGSTVAWSGAEWVRFDGADRSLRVFPGAAWVDLQFAGADEGTLTGLRYRFGVPRRLTPPEGAPPEVHLRLGEAEDLSPAVQLLVTAWLEGTVAADAAPPAPAVSPEGLGQPARARNAGRPARSG